MKILNERPPIYDQLLAAGLNFDPARTVFAYGEAIYNPASLNLPQHIIEHEGTHLNQQKTTDGGPDGWWARYIGDPYFRIQQETEAYAVQLRYIAKTKSKKMTLAALVDLAGFLSGPMYGSMVTREDALKMIRDKAGVI